MGFEYECIWHELLFLSLCILHLSLLRIYAIGPKLGCISPPRSECMEIHTVCFEFSDFWFFMLYDFFVV